jgi:hypothetical protein
LKKDNQNDELYKMLLDSRGNASFPEMYLEEKARRMDIEKRYDILVTLIKEEGCNRVSQRIQAEINKKKRLH